MIQTLFRWINLFLIGLTLLVYTVPYIDPDTMALPALLAPAFPWLLLMHLLFIAGWVRVRHWYFLLSTCCLLLGFQHIQTFVGLRLPSRAPAESLAVLSYNISRMQLVADRTAFHAFIQKRAGKPQLLCLQEADSPIGKQLAKEMGYPHIHAHPKLGTAILSHLPFQNKGSLDFERSGNSVVWADVQYQGKPLRVYSVHLQSNKISADAETLAEKGNLRDRETWQGIRGILGKYRRAIRVRHHQTEKLLEHVRQSPHPVLICGDVNDTPLSHTYQLLSLGRQDTFRAAGSGIGSTYAGILPALRIDYILADPEFRVLTQRTYRVDYSDHYPVLAHLSW
jgi:endonuclease/exonuclease/phosphatase family metal-dependent hydrolase